MNVFVSLSADDVRPSVELLNVGVITHEPRLFSLDDNVVESLKRRGLVVVSADDDSKKHNKVRRGVYE